MAVFAVHFLFVRGLAVAHCISFGLYTDFHYICLIILTVLWEFSTKA